MTITCMERQKDNAFRIFRCCVFNRPDKPKRPVPLNAKPNLPIINTLRMIDNSANSWLLVENLGQQNQPHHYRWVSPFEPNEQLNPIALASKLTNSNNSTISNGFSGLFQSGMDDIAGFVLTLVGNFLNSAFFFSPFRRGKEKSPSQSDVILNTDGNNLPARLFTAVLNEKQEFHRIEKFAQEALSNIGDLNPRVIGSETHIEFEQDVMGKPLSTRLHAMGGGVEQLLMVAAALETTSVDAPLFLEEPESHLHPGAQRYLLEKLVESGRQVFITTHSSVFLGDLANQNRTSIYRVSQSNRRTSIARVDGAALSTALQELGVINSDLLLREGLVFVENDYDGQALSALAKTLDKPLTNRNIAFVPIGGATALNTIAPSSSTALERLHQGALAIPHLFLIDRDERSEADLEKLKRNANIQDTLHVFERRELENYLLVPSALNRYVKAYKPCNDVTVQTRREATNAVEIEGLIQAARDNLKSKTLAKRIASALSRDHRVFILDREDISGLEHILSNENYAEQVKTFIEKQLLIQAKLDRIPALVEEEHFKFENDWSDELQRKNIAPGEEIICAVLKHFSIGTKNIKAEVPKIAAFLKPNEIAQELKDLILRIYDLPKR